MCEVICLLVSFFNLFIDYTINFQYILKNINAMIFFLLVIVFEVKLSEAFFGMVAVLHDHLSSGCGFP